MPPGTLVPLTVTLAELSLSTGVIIVEVTLLATLAVYSSVLGENGAGLSDIPLAVTVDNRLSGDPNDCFQIVSYSGS